MSKYITQVRYYGENDERNSDKNVSAQTLTDGSAFEAFSSITQLGIQTSPVFECEEGGTKHLVRPSFYVNNGISSIQIGRTGIYELDLEGLSVIQNLRLAKDFVNAIDKCGDGAHVIIDLVYDK